jgi:hypothetical protein
MLDNSLVKMRKAGPTKTWTKRTRHSGALGRLSVRTCNASNDIRFPIRIILLTIITQPVNSILHHCSQAWQKSQEWFENIPYAGQLFGEDEEGRSYQDLDEEDATLA